MMRSERLSILLAGTIAISAIGAAPPPKARSKRDRAREIEAMAELAEKVHEIDRAIELLDALRRVCAERGPPCETADAETLEQIGWLCLQSKTCAARRPALIAEIKARAPALRALIHDLEESLKPEDAEATPSRDEGPPPSAGIDRLRAHLLEHPGDLDARMDLADALIAANRKDEAVRELSRYLEARPDDLDARESLIDLLVALERRSAALSEIAVYLARRPAAWRMRDLEIELLAKDKRAADLDRALAAMVRDAPGRGLAWAYLAGRALDRDDLAGAERALERARATTSTDAETREKIAEVVSELSATRARSELEFWRDVRRYDLEDDLRYGGETE
jgi:predicted Zn-dependent protease